MQEIIVYRSPAEAAFYHNADVIIVFLICFLALFIAGMLVFERISNRRGRMTGAVTFLWSFVSLVSSFFLTNLYVKNIVSLVGWLIQ